MKKFFLVLGILVVLLIGAVAAAPFLVPTETIKSQLTAQVEAATGRELAVDGALDLSVFPSIAVDMGDVRFANAPGSEVADMVSLKQLKVELKALPLLTGAVEVDQFVLVEPRIHLEVDANGRANWELEGEGDGSEEAVASDGGDEAAGDDGGSLPVTELKLGDIRIEDGSLVFVDHATGTEERVEAIDMQLGLADLQSPLDAKGSLDYKGETIELDLNLASPYDVLQAGSSALALGIKSAPLALSFDGELGNQGAPSTAGSIDLSIPSVKGLAAWLAEPLQLDTEALEALTITGQLNGSADKIAFTDAKIGLDKISGRGEVTADLAGSTPKVSGRLDLGMVDLNPYMPPAAEGEGTGDEEAQATTESDAGGAADWSDEPIELGFGGVDLAFELTLEGLKANEVKLQRTVLALNMTGPKLTADLKEFGLYDGQGQGRLVVDASSGQPRIEKQFTLNGLQALPFLTDAAEFERLEGTANAEFKFSATGGTERELVENMNGDGKVTFLDGAVVGVNIAAMVRNVGSAFLSAEANETRKTDFAELGGSFIIENGILTNDDLLLQAPALRLSGAGTVDLPQRQVDYRIDPKAAATLEGQEGESEVAGVLVPVVITGPFDDLSYKPDLSGLVDQAIKDPKALKKNVKQQLDALGDSTKDINSTKDVKKALKKIGKDDGKKLLDNLSKGDEDTGDSPAGKLIKGLFD